MDISKYDEKLARFLRVAPRRTDRVLHALEVLGNCSNKINYQYNEEQIRRIFLTIKDKLLEVEVRFRDKKRPKFEL